MFYSEEFKKLDKNFQVLQVLLGHDWKVKAKRVERVYLWEDYAPEEKGIDFKDFGHLSLIESQDSAKSKIEKLFYLS